MEFLRLKTDKKKRLLPIIIVCAITIFIACQKKSIPVITDRNAPPPKRTSSTYPPVANVKADTVQGRILYSANCSRCHALPVLQQFTTTVWDGYLSSMFPRTRLNNEEAFHVRAYVLANAQH